MSYAQDINNNNNLNVISQNLINDHNKLKASHNMLLDDHKVLVANHELLVDNHDKLIDNYNKLINDHNLLKASHDMLADAHKRLGVSHNILVDYHKNVIDGLNMLTNAHKRLGASYEAEISSLKAEVGEMRSFLGLKKEVKKGLVNTQEVSQSVPHSVFNSVQPFSSNNDSLVNVDVKPELADDRFAKRQNNDDLNFEI